MTGDKNEIDNLIDTMIESGDELVNNLKTVLPNSLSESMIMFHESNVENLKKIKAILEVRKQKFDLIVNLYNAGSSRIMVQLSGAKYKLGFCNQEKKNIYIN